MRGNLATGNENRQDAAGHWKAAEKYVPAPPFSGRPVDRDQKAYITCTDA
jgi:hypothetical protein